MRRRAKHFFVFIFFFFFLFHLRSIKRKQVVNSFHYWYLLIQDLVEIDSDWTRFNSHDSLDDSTHLHFSHVVTMEGRDSLLQPMYYQSFKQRIHENIALFFKFCTHFVPQTELKITVILLPLTPERWDHRLVLLCLATDLSTRKLTLWGKIRCQFYCLTFTF